MLYDTYLSWYNWYYGLPMTTEETTQRVIEITDEGEVLGIGTINTTTTGDQIIPTLCMTQIIPSEEETRNPEEEKTTVESQEETRIESSYPPAQLPLAPRPSLAESLKTYMIETNYRLQKKKKHNR